MSKVILEGYIVVPDDDLEAVSAELQTHIALTQEEEGCLLFQVTQKPGAPNVFNVYEEFVDQSAFELHQQRVRQSAWGEITTNVERNYTVREQD
ncbi:putative quinol monooxygenase [Marinobacterium mangrovicola]|uniref:Quinol monooxygenase YgiN n=1 Tax=Marinobacterium mangrovicola TaxID=1476959 RepID=A0A4R1GN68_9GAMM|nr:putative quinol monooxygenase [Marinobacterium mangrovicola]TCK08663.1 quinol monooxygenase YgiN [Marinobacterium mangrovicola]